MKRISSILLAAILFMTLCNVSAVADDNAVELSLWHSMSGVNGTFFEGLVDEFNQTIGAENGIKVVPVYQGSYVESSKKLRAIYASGDLSSLPDLIQTAPSQHGYMKGLEEVVTLDEITALDPEIKLDDFEPNAIASYTFQDSHISVPLSATTVVMYYNADQFEEAGLTCAPETVEEIGTYSAALYQEDENGKATRYGFATEMQTWFISSFIGMQSSSHGDFGYLVNNRNGYDGDADAVEFVKEGTMKNLLTAWKQAYDTGHFKYLVEGSGVDEFAAEKISSYLWSSASLSSVKKAVGDKFNVGVAFMPKVNPGDKGGAAYGGNALNVMDNGKNHIAESIRFIKFMISPQTQYEWFTKTGYSPINLNTFDLAEMKAFMEENPLYTVSIDQLHSSNPQVSEPCIAVTTAFDDIIDEMFIGVIEDDYTIDEAIDIMQEEMNEALQSVL